MELPSYRTIFRVSGFKVEFSGTPNVRMGEKVKVYGVFVGDGIIARAIETEGAIYITEE